jgi:hypothetical protein
MLSKWSPASATISPNVSVSPWGELHRPVARPLVAQQLVLVGRPALHEERGDSETHADAVRRNAGPPSIAGRVGPNDGGSRPVRAAITTGRR